MLSAEERDIVRRHGIAALHDYQINSIVTAKHFSSREYCRTTTVRTLLICGQSMRDLHPPSSDTAEEVVHGWIDAGAGQIQFFT